MKIAELIDGLPVQLARGAQASEIAEVVEDSRQVVPGCLFIARGGTKTDGRRFIDDAIARGAAAVLTDDASAVGSTCAALLARDVAQAAAQIAERFHGHPSSQLKLIGITGTNGKTTTTYLVRHLLRSAGIRCGLIGTVEIDDGSHAVPAELTTPPAIALSRLVRQMVANDCGACVMETSSHALHQKRTAGLNFHIGVFTNITGDHLDYHLTMDAYLAAKAILFESLPVSGFAIVNGDDPAWERMAQRTRAKLIRCSLQDESADWFARVGNQSLNAIEVEFKATADFMACQLPLIGRHNVMNALQALAVCSALGISNDVLAQSIATCKAPPGRLEPVTKSDDPFAVLVDYAHTDDALENVLRALRPILSANGSGRLRVVFGCGGDRDRTKRPRMANIACKYADDVIITSDNPRTEDPHAIIEEIRTGIPPHKLGNVICIPDRKAAIETAIERTGDGDIVLIAGKGHEDYQIVGTVKRPFDDRKIAAAALANRLSGVSAA